MILSKTALEFFVLSVRPRFAEAIVDGRKTIELRRQRPNVQPGTLGFVYSSSPMQAVVGSFRVDRVFSGTPDELWLVAQRAAYISRQDFDSYFAGVDFGHGIEVSCGRRLPRPIGLAQLRAIWPECKPPRSFGYLVAADAYAQRTMSSLRHRLFGDAYPIEEAGRGHVGRKGLLERKGSFQLKWDEVRALASLWGSEVP